MIKVQENLYSIREYFQNIADEMYGLFSMRKNIIDSIIPPLIFVIINEVVGFELAMWSSLIIATIFAVFRVVRGQSILSALGGIAAVVVAIVFVKLIGRDESYFIPSILGNFFWLAVFLISILVGKPILGLASHFLRKWPLSWYWHPRVKPAYFEVSLFWLVLLVARAYLQVILYLNQAVDELAIVTLLTGTPATIVLIVSTYIYGRWRLQQLGGPSVLEFESDIMPPWSGQQKGF